MNHRKIYRKKNHIRDVFVSSGTFLFNRWTFPIFLTHWRIKHDSFPWWGLWRTHLAVCVRGDRWFSQGTKKYCSVIKLAPMLAESTTCKINHEYLLHITNTPSAYLQNEKDAFAALLWEKDRQGQDSEMWLSNEAKVRERWLLQMDHSWDTVETQLS